MCEMMKDISLGIACRYQFDFSFGCEHAELQTLHNARTPERFAGAEPRGAGLREREKLSLLVTLNERGERSCFDFFERQPCKVRQVNANVIAQRRERPAMRINLRHRLQELAILRAGPRTFERRAEYAREIVHRF